MFQDNKEMKKDEEPTSTATVESVVEVNTASSNSFSYSSNDDVMVLVLSKITPRGLKCFFFKIMGYEGKGLVENGEGIMNPL